MIAISWVCFFSHPHKHIYHNLEDIDQNRVFPKESWVSGAPYLQSIKQELHIYHFQTQKKLFLNSLCQRSLLWDLALSEKQ